MNQKDLEKLKRSQVQILDEVHRICCENNMIYYIIGGTALGAVRHNGFIPWDIDIDIAMPRPDYERFADYAYAAEDSRFAYHNHRNTRGYGHTHARYSIRNTKLIDKIEHLNLNTENIGIYIDIFPLDNAPEAKKLQEDQANKIAKIKKKIVLKQARVYQKDFKNLVIKKIVSKMMFWTDLRKLIDSFEKECRKYENKQTDFVCSMHSHYKYSKQCMHKDIYGTPSLVEFEGKEYYAPEKLDCYLTRIYGDYMKLPPEDERNYNLGIFTKVDFDV